MIFRYAFVLALGVGSVSLVALADVVGDTIPEEIQAKIAESLASVWKAEVPLEDPVATAFAPVGVDNVFAAGLSGTAGAGGSDVWKKVLKESVLGVVYLFVPEQGYATGFMVAPGMIVTNEHVSRGAFSCDVGRCINVMRAESDALNPLLLSPRTDRIATAVLVAEDRARDLALFRISEADPYREWFNTVTPLQLCAPEGAVEPLDEVLLIGNNGNGLLWSTKRGHVQQIGYYGETVDVLHRVDTVLKSHGVSNASREQRLNLASKELPIAKTLVIQAGVSAARGDSGAPLLDSEGRVVGVCTRSNMLPGDDTPRYFYVHFRELAAFLKANGIG